MPKDEVEPQSEVKVDAERAEIVQFCADQAAWLMDVAEKHDVAKDESIHRALRCLVDRANREPSSAKKQIFLIVRCHRCLQHCKGGEKHDFEVKLPAPMWTWLEAVRERSRHPTIGKTLRILVDFYKPLCEGDAAFEHSLFKAGLARDPCVQDGVVTEQAAGA